MPAETRFDPSVNLVYGDVRVDSIADPHYLVVVIKASKTDVFRKRDHYLLRTSEGKVMPSGSILSYMAVRGSTSTWPLQVSIGTFPH